MKITELARLAIKHETQLELLANIAEVIEQIQVTKDPDHKFYQGFENMRRDDIKAFEVKKDLLVQQYKAL